MKTRLRKAEPLISGRALETLHRLKTLLQVRRPVTVILSSDFPEPGVCGIWRPKVVLPKGVVEALTDQELEAVLPHELAHVRRRDNLVSLFQSWLSCVFWFHPVIWLIDHQLLEERERACDEEVLSRTPNCQEYLSSLLKVFRSSLGEKLAGASLITGSNLKRRIDHMRSHGCRKNSVIRHRLSLSVFVLAWIASVAGTALVSQKVVVAQQNLESAELASNSLNEEHPTAALHGVRSGVAGGVRSGVAAGILRGVKGEAPKRPSRSEKQTSEPPLGPASSGPGTGGGIGAGTGGGVGPGKGGGVGPGEGGGIGSGVAVNQTPSSPGQQAGSAKLFGTVSDASQARVPDATVVISAKERGTKEITISGAIGEYEFRALPVGRYSIEVRLPGFRPFQQSLELQANEPRKLDVVLEVGEVQANHKCGREGTTGCSSRHALWTAASNSRRWQHSTDEVGPSSKAYLSRTSSSPGDSRDCSSGSRDLEGWHHRNNACVEQAGRSRPGHFRRRSGQELALRANAVEWTTHRSRHHDYGEFSFVLLLVRIAGRSDDSLACSKHSIDLGPLSPARERG